MEREINKFNLLTSCFVVGLAVIVGLSDKALAEGGHHHHHHHHVPSNPTQPKMPANTNPTDVGDLVDRTNEVVDLTLVNPVVKETPAEPSKPKFQPGAETSKETKVLVIEEIPSAQKNSDFQPLVTSPINDSVSYSYDASLIPEECHYHLTEAVDGNLGKMKMDLDGDGSFQFEGIPANSDVAVIGFAVGENHQKLENAKEEIYVFKVPESGESVVARQAELVDQNQVVSIRLPQIDLEAGEKVEVIQMPEGAEYDPETGEIKWAPAKDQTGTNEIEVVITTTKNEKRLLQKTLYVVNNNRAPKFNRIKSVRVVEKNETIRFRVPAYDPDNDELFYSIKSDVPKNASFDPEKQLFEWTPGQFSSGTHYILFHVTDGDKSDEYQIAIRVP